MAYSNPGRSNHDTDFYHTGDKAMKTYQIATIPGDGIGKEVVYSGSTF